MIGSSIIYSILKQRFGDDISVNNLPKPFYYNNENINTSTTDKWDKSLGNFGLIPKKWEKFIKSLLDEENKDRTKYIICDISNAIMKINREIWKMRCKILYSNSHNDNNPP